MVLQETKIRLSKVVLFKDAFTGKPVSSGIRIHSAPGVRTEKKNGGYVLFLNVEAPEFEVEVDSPIYRNRKICFKADAGEELEEILLYPSPSYPRREGFTTVRGRSEPGSVFLCYIEEEKVSLRLLTDYQAGETQISFYRKNGIWSALWHIGKKQENAGEYFHSGDSDADSEIYQLKQPLKSDYRKKDTVIYPAKECMADENGEFYLMFEDIPEKTCILKYFYKCAEQEIYGETEIIRAKENRILED